MEGLLEHGEVGAQAARVAQDVRGVHLVDGLLVKGLGRGPLITEGRSGVPDQSPDA
jgi:hypothetical protein